MADKHQDVDKFMQQLDHPQKAVVELLRVAIRSAGVDIEERIKWNAPSFGPTDEDRVTFNLHAKDTKSNSSSIAVPKPSRIKVSNSSTTLA